MNLCFEVISAHRIYGTFEIEDLRTKELVPKMTTRRRLTRNSRVVVDLIDALAYTNNRIVYGSALGEIISSTKILTSYLANESCSPTEFQNSVYNTPASYLSILSDNQNEIITVSSGDRTSLDTLKCAAIKALDGDEIVILCSEALNIGVESNLNSMATYLECGVGLKIRQSDTKKCLNIDGVDMDEELKRLPSSLWHIAKIAKSYEEGKRFFEVGI